MYDINFKNLKKGKLTYLIPLGAGIFFLILMLGVLIFNINKSNKMDKSVLTTNIIVKEDYDSDDDITYSPVYYYEVKGESYVCKSKSSSSTYPDTSKGLVYYNSEDPTECMTEYDKSGNGILLLFLILPLTFIALGIVMIIKTNKKIKLVKELNNSGKLIKNIPYTLIPSGMVVNGRTINKIAINYQLSSGTIITLYSDPRYDNKEYDNDGKVDLLIDPNNIENYYIDFEINRISGNLPTDYNQTITTAPTINPSEQSNDFINKIKNKFNE